MRLASWAARSAALTLLLSATTAAHIGSPDTWFEGMAGPYPVRVVVRLPGVIPGLAQIDIGVTGTDVDSVTAQPVIFDAGKEGAPPPDRAEPVPGRPGSYHAQLWFMTVGSFSVNVEVTGKQGKGTAIVPVAAVAIRQIGLYPWLGKLLFALGAFLFIGAVTIFRAAASDTVVEPGQTVPPRQRRVGQFAMFLGGGLLSLLLWGGNSWWNAVARNYQRQLYQPFNAQAAIVSDGAARVLEFTITDSVWSSRRPQRLSDRFAVSPLVPDHGKLMHLFMIRHDDQGAFAHLHPISVDSTRFHASVGDLPAGQYDVFADVVHESGFPQTMVASVELSTGDQTKTPFTDPDDATAVAQPTGNRFALPDGGNVTWERPDRIVADQDAGLRFVVTEPDGSVAKLAPYLGMVSHAVVEKSDRSVYVHLHPSGTISMVAQAALGERRRTDTLPGMLAERLTAESGAMMHSMTPSFDGTFSFPYAFPNPGRYRVWVQVRRSAGIATAVFDADVQ